MTKFPSKWRKVVMVAIITSVILVAAFAIVAKVFGISDAAASYELNREKAKAANLNFTSDDVTQMVAAKETDNGAALFRSYAEAFRSNFKGVSIGELSDQKFMAKWQGVETTLPNLKLALDKPKIILRPNITKPFDYFGSVVSESPISRRLEIALKANDLAASRILLPIIAKLCIHASDEPYYSQRRISLATQVEELIRQEIPIHGHNPQWRILLEQALAILDSPYDLKQHLRFNHWADLWSAKIMLGDTKTGTPEDLGFKREDSLPTKILIGRHLPLFGTAQLSRIHEFYADLVNGLPTDSHDLRGLTKHLTNPYRLRRYPDISSEFLASTDEHIYELGRGIEAEAAKRNVLLQSLAILRTQADLSKGFLLKGRFLDDVGGKQIQVEKYKQGWIIYSIGKNGKDEHSVTPATSIDDFIVYLPPLTPSKQIGQPR